MNNKNYKNNEFFYESNKKGISFFDVINIVKNNKKLFLFITGIGIFTSIILHIVQKEYGSGNFKW